MKWVCFLAFATLSLNSVAESDRVYLVGKRQVTNSNHTHIVLFYDRGITELADCQREIQRGYRGQWRYYHHKFARVAGAAEKLNYYCIKSNLRFDEWYKKAHYNHMYQFDLRSKRPKIKKMGSYAKCLHDLRRNIRDESHTFFCAKLSQKLRL